MIKKLAKIQKVTFGLGGYQGVRLGLHVHIAAKGWGTYTSDDFWDFENIQRSEYTQWTEASRERQACDVLRKVSLLLKQAKKESVDQLAGVPVECEFDGFVLKSWRILTEVL